GLSAALLAHKLLRRAVEIASAARRGGSGNDCQGRCGARDAGIQAGHRHGVAIDLTRGRCYIDARRGERYRIGHLTGLSKNLGCKQRATQEAACTMRGMSRALVASLRPSIFDCDIATLKPLCTRLSRTYGQRSP